MTKNARQLCAGFLFLGMAVLLWLYGVVDSISMIRLLVIGFGIWVIAICLDLYKSQSDRMKITAASIVSAFALLSFALAVMYGVRAYREGEAFGANLATSFGSIAITVFVLDNLNERRRQEDRKQELIEEIESPVRDVAVEAVRLARKYGWLNEALKKANLEKAQLSGANLEGAKMQGAFLWRANLQGANLRGANLQGANLTRANLENADLIGANLQNTNLAWANLHDATFSRADLQGANLSRLDLSGAYFVDVNLQDANLMRANLQEAHFHRVNLQGAILIAADLQKAIFLSANLQGANLKETKLLGASYTKETSWPEGFNPRKAGAIAD